MSDADAFPTSYEQWRHCIEVRGKIKLTSSYISQRLTEMQNEKHANTIEFAKLYGNERLQQTIKWFQRAASEV
ncbi:MAG: hypothetical protein AAF497_22480 [Planctomycetota bacterium]